MQYGFWNSVTNDADDIEVGYEVFKSIKSCNKICTEGIPFESWGKDRFLLLLWQMKTNHRIEIETNPEKCIVDVFNTNTPNTEELSTVYLMDNQVKCDLYKKQYGVLSLTDFNIKKSKYYLNGTAVPYDLKESSDEYIKCKEYLSTPCNSLLIIDPYLFDEEHYIEKDLKPLLKNILPKNLEIPFHITILSQPLNCLKWHNNSIKTESGIKLFFEKHVIEELKKELGLTYDIKYTLCHCTKTSEKRNGVKGDLHSRQVYTNNMMVYSRDGFDLFGKKDECGKWAKFDFVWTGLDDNSRKDVDEYYRWLDIAKKNISNPNKCLWSCSNSENDNRLFDLVKD